MEADDKVTEEDMAKEIAESSKLRANERKKLAAIEESLTYQRAVKFTTDRSVQ